MLFCRYIDCFVSLGNQIDFIRIRMANSQDVQSFRGYTVRRKNLNKIYDKSKTFLILS